MTREETRSLLVEQGAKMLTATVKAIRAEELLAEARQEFAEAARPVVNQLDAFNEHMFSIDEEEQFARESAVLAGLDPDSPELRFMRDGFKRYHHAHEDQRLLAQRANAELN